MFQARLSSCVRTCGVSTDLDERAATTSIVGIHIRIPWIPNFAVAIDEIVIAKLSDRKVLHRNPHAGSVFGHGFRRPIVKVADELDALGPRVFVLEKYVSNRRPARF